MSTNTFGDNFRITTFGESHGPAIGVVIDGLYPGVDIDFQAVQKELDRRRPGVSDLTSPRKEKDQLEVLSGIFQGKTTGAPIAIIIRNSDARSQHYDTLKDLFRPGHADYTFFKKYGIRDWRGGGRSSGRETACRVAAGAIARQMLEHEGVCIVGHVVQVGGVTASEYSAEEIEKNPVRTADATAADAMANEIRVARKAGDSVGGVVEIRATGVPAGWGDPIFQKLDAQLAAALMSIGAVKGVEVGDGFALCDRRGSETNDAIHADGFATNQMGGILGGISNGSPIVARIAVKPTASIRVEQQTITKEGLPTTLVVPGRHDPCICPRVVPVAESMMALVLVDAYLHQQAVAKRAEGSTQIAAELAFREAELLRSMHAYRAVVSEDLGDKALADQIVQQRHALAEELDISPLLADRLIASAGSTANSALNETKK
jgi:chorismate synthase